MKVTWKFVNQPVANPTVLLDMNRQDGTLFLDMGKPFDISPPPLRQSFNVNAMVDGAQMTASAYDNRVLKFSLALQGNVAQKNALIVALNQQFSKDKNLLMYRPSPTSTPVFFRTIKSDDYTITNRGGSAEAWSVDCEVLAEPFAIGTRVDYYSGAVVTNNPASGTNPAFLDFTGIIGDAPTPPLIRISPGATGGLKNNPIYIAQRTGGLTFTNYLQAEDGTNVTPSTDTATTTLASNASGGTPNALSTTFATTVGMSGRMTTHWTATTGLTEALRGRYRVLARVSTDTEGSTFKIRTAVIQGASYIRSRPVQITLSSVATSRKLVDLGVIAWPPYEAPQEIGYSGLVPGVEGIYMIIDAQRVSGGVLYWDYLYLLPADERLCIVSAQTTDGGNGAYQIVLDGPNDATYGLDSGSSPFGATTSDRVLFNAFGIVPRIGGLPILTPGVSNRWYILQESAPVTNTLLFDVSYWPHWREVATP